MKKSENLLNNWKNFLIIFFVGCFILNCLYIIVFEKNNNIFYVKEDLYADKYIDEDGIIYKLDTKKNNIKYIGILFEVFDKNDSGIVNICIYDKEKIVYKSYIPISCLKENKEYKIKVNFYFDKGKEYRLFINKENSKKELSVLKLSFGYGDKSDVIIMMKKIGIAFLVVVFLCLLTAFYEKIITYVDKSFDFMRKKKIIAGEIEIFLCYMVIHKVDTKFELQVSMKIVLFIVSLLAGIFFDVSCDKVELFCGEKNKIIVYFLAFYGAFITVGQRLLIYPKSQNLFFEKILYYLLTVLWYIPVIALFLNVFVNFIRIAKGNNSKQEKNIFFVFLSAILLIIPSLLALIAFNPGISSLDTENSMVVNAHNLHGMYDWHPFFYCFILKNIINIWDSTYIVVFWQMIFWVYVIVEAMIFLKKEGCNEKNLLIITAIIGFSPVNFIHIITIWKDIPYTLSLFWIVVIISKLLVDNTFYKYKLFIYFEMVLSLVGICLYRKNGIVPFFILIIYLLILFKKNIRVFISICVSVLCVIIVKIPLYNYYDVRDSGTSGIYIGLGQDILGVYYNNGMVSENTLAMINEMTDENIDGYNYKMTWSYAEYDISVEPVEFVRNYLDVFLHNPGLMTKLIICREDCVWNIFEGKDTQLGCINYLGNMDYSEKWQKYYPKQKDNVLTNILKKITSNIAFYQMFSVIQWRCGLTTFIALITICIGYLKKKRKIITIAIVPLSHIIGLLLSTGWSDFRYFWPINLMNIYIILYIVCGINDKEEVE